MISSIWSQTDVLRVVGKNFWQAELKQWFLLSTFCYVVVIIIVNCATVFLNAPSPLINVELCVGELRNSSPWNTCSAPAPASAPSASAAPAPTSGRPRGPALEVTAATLLIQGYTDLWKIKCQSPFEIWNVNKISSAVIWSVVTIFW